MRLNLHNHDHSHILDKEHLSEEFHHMVHDKAFWIVVGLVVIAALLILGTAYLSWTGQPADTMYEPYPFFPYYGQ